MAKTPSLLALLLIGCGAPPQKYPPVPAGQIALHISTEIRDGGQLRALRVELGEAGAHPEGRLRGEGWVSVPLLAARAELIQVHRPHAIAEGVLPGGYYDEVRVLFSSIVGERTNGTAVEVNNIVEPIALAFAMRPDRGVRVALRFILLEHPYKPIFEMFTMKSEFID